MGRQRAEGIVRALLFGPGVQGPPEAQFLEHWSGAFLLVWWF
jgi:hypothetical protein